MDVAKDQNCHNRQEEKEECPDDEEPDPDTLSGPRNNEKRTGRFIIEEIEDHKYEEDNYNPDLDGRDSGNLCYSFRESRIHFKNKEIVGEELERVKKECASDWMTSSCPGALVLDKETGTYINCVNLWPCGMQTKETTPLIFDYCYMYPPSQELHFPDDIPDNDYAMIIQEETIENEVDQDISGNNKGNCITEIISLQKENGEKIQHAEIMQTNSIKTSSNLKFAQRKGSAADIVFRTTPHSKRSSRNNRKDTHDLTAEKNYKSLEINFTNCKEGWKEFISPKVSPIPSPRDHSLANKEANVNPNGNFLTIPGGSSKFTSKTKNLYSTSSYKPKNNRVKMIKDFIRSIENSFNLDDNEVEEECKRKKRIYSADKSYCKKFKSEKKHSMEIEVRSEVKVKSLKCEKNASMNFLNGALNCHNSTTTVYTSQLSIEQTISFSSNVNLTACETMSSYSNSLICKNCLTKI